MPEPAFIVPPCPGDFSLVYQDSSLLVVNKPAGLLSVPGRLPENRDCLISRVQRQFTDALIVHRLDMATSGLMVLARDKNSHRALSALFQQRRVEKHYHSVVFGTLDCSRGLVDLPLCCDWPRRPRQHVNFLHGKPAQTWYERIGATPAGHSELLLRPITGRSHQLRVHMASIGHPILGCDFYAHGDAKDAAPRLMLHASGLAFPHPQTGELLRFQSPPDFSPHSPTQTSS